MYICNSAKCKKYARWAILLISMYIYVIILLFYYVYSSHELITNIKIWSIVKNDIQYFCKKKNLHF